MDLARESATVDSSSTTDTASTLPDDGNFSSQQQEDAVATTTETGTELLVAHESKTSLSNDEALISLSCTDADPVSQTQLSDSVPCQVKCDIEFEKPDVHQKEADILLGEGGINSKDVHVSLPPDPDSNTKYDLIPEETEPVDVSKLGSALWPKMTLVSADDNDCSFTALVAEHESYCKEHAEDVSSQAAFLSSCNDHTEVVHDDHKALWPVVSRWLKESDKQCAKQQPRCSELIRGILLSDDKHDVSSDKSPPKLTTVDAKNALSLTPVSSETKIKPVSSLDTCSQNTGIFSDVNDTGLGVEPECSNQPPLPAFLSREKILSLQFNRVPLSPKVMSRVKELRLKRTDGGGMLWPSVGKRVTRNTPSYQQLQSNSSSITVQQSRLVFTEDPVNYASTEGTYNHQTMNHADVKLDAILAGVDTAASSDQTNVQKYTSVPTSFESDYTEVVNGKTCTILSSPTVRQSKTLQYGLTPAISCFHPVSDASADTPVADMTSDTKKPVNNLHSAGHGPMKTCPTADVPSCSSAVLSPISTATAEMSAKTHPDYVHLKSSTRAASLAVRERMPAKKCSNSKLTDISQTPADFSYHDDLVPPQAQQNIHRSKHNVTSRNQRRETDERLLMKQRCGKSRKEFWYNEGFAYCPVDREIDSPSQCESQCSNVGGNAAYDRKHSRTRYHQSHTSKHNRSFNTFDHESYYRPYFMPTVTPSYLASVSYSSYCLGAYNAHVHSMHYYNMLSQEASADMWQQQDNYIRRMAKLYACLLYTSDAADE